MRLVVSDPSTLIHRRTKKCPIWVMDMATTYPYNGA